MLDSESKKPKGERVDFVSVATPNHMHFDVAKAALQAGFHVICDKPMTNTLQEAEALHAKVQSSGRVFCLTHNYTGYPMVRQAKAMVMDGLLGDIRLVQVEYVQGGRAKGGPGFRCALRLIRREAGRRESAA